MTESSTDASFAKIVDWAYTTLPEKIKNLPDFPGIQILDEPPAKMFERMSKRGNWPPGTELLGCYSGISRTQRRFNLMHIAPDVIFVFRGPILRCSKGNLSAKVKRVVWHEVAHWLGHNEEEVKELGLSFGVEDGIVDPSDSEAPITVSQERHLDNESEEEANEPPRCINCYSADVTCPEVDKPLSYAGGNLFDPITVHAKSCKCNSCGYEWDDEDTY
jgi:predicted Zn-dependent protease with MMP-like domain